MSSSQEYTLVQRTEPLATSSQTKVPLHH